MSFIGHPVVGDAIYNRTRGHFGGVASIVPRQFLHASLLSFRLPVSEELVTFESALPDDLAGPLSVLEHEMTAVGPS